MNLYTEQQMRDAIKMARNGARSEDNIIDSLNFIKQHSEVTMSNNKQDHINDTNKMLGVVDWLEQEFLKLESTVGVQGVFYELLEQAKEKHKKEMINFTTDWYHNGSLLGGEILVSTSVKEHYNKTFGGNND